ncbi:hypothetical protein ACQW02_25470 [Humitalea sp. 24SJ18S-53]|uniref:phage major capsid protein n=1 Tax=Humitalea sp. 24SJ18S-53 TaxID=3422307 RepID=UPI003D671226
MTLRAILEAAAGASNTYRVRVIRAGLSANGNLYPDAVLREAVALFQGARVFVKGDREHLAGAGKDVRNLIGGLSEPRFVEGGKPNTGAIEAVLTLILGEADPIATKLREAVTLGLTDLFGLSVDVAGTSVAGAGGVRVARRFAKVNSVDLIVEPGAGGQVIAFREAAGEGTTMDRDQLLAFLKANNPALLEGVDEATVTVEALQAILAGAIAPAPAAGRTVEADGDPATMGRDDLIAAITAIDPSKLPADVAAATEDDLRAVLVALRAAPPAATTAMIEAAMDRRDRMRAQVAASALPPAARNRVLADLRNTNFTEAALTRRIQSEGEYLASLGVGRVPGGVGGYGSTRIGEDQAEKHERMLEAFFDPKHKDHKHARSFKECYILLTGDNRVTGRLENVRFAEALASTTFASVLGNSITRKMIADYRAATDLDMWKLLATVTPVGDFRSQERTRFGGYGDLPAVAESAPYVALTSPTDEKASYAVTKRGGTENVTLEMIKNDDVGAIQRIPVKMARAAKRTLAKFVLDFLRSNPVAYDGVALFHATHNNLSVAALSAVSYAAVRLAMTKQTEFGSTEALGIGPKYLWLPPELEETASNLFRRNTNLDQTFVQTLTPTIIPVWYWTDINDWAVSVDPLDIPTVEVGFLDGEEEPALLVQDNPSVGSLFTNDTITYKIRHIYGGTALDWRGVSKAVVP